jgi:ABC-type spermidine/putrescine transport system permease subunit II
MFQKNKSLIFIGFVAVLIVYSFNSSKWRGYAYPDKNNLSNSIYLGEFKTEDECNTSAINTLRKISSISAGDFECHKD